MNSGLFVTAHTGTRLRVRDFAHVCVIFVSQTYKRAHLERKRNKNVVYRAHHLHAASGHVLGPVMQEKGKGSYRAVQIHLLVVGCVLQQFLVRLVMKQILVVRFL